MPYCPNCGEEVESEDAFCQSCGASLDDVEAATSTEPDPATEPARDPEPTADAGGTRESASASGNPGERSRTGTGSTGSNAGTGAGASTTGSDRSVPYGLGFVAGAFAFAAGYVVTHIQKADEATQPFGGLGAISADLSSTPETWQGVGWVFMVMHNVALEASATFNGQTRTETLSSGGLEEQWLLLVPVVTLVVAGYYVASNVDRRYNVGGAKAGATVVVGYFVCAVALAFLSDWTASASALNQSASISIGPSLVEAAAIAGLGYPIVLGGIGGALADS